MIEYQQILTLVITSSLYFFLLWLVRSYNFKVSKYWLTSISCIVLGELFSVLERIGFPFFFNVLEHLSFTAACLLFFIGIVTMEDRNE